MRHTTSGPASPSACSSEDRNDRRAIHTGKPVVASERNVDEPANFSEQGHGTKPSDPLRGFLLASDAYRIRGTCPTDVVRFPRPDPVQNWTCHSGTPVPKGGTGIPAERGAPRPRLCLWTGEGCRKLRKRTWQTSTIKSNVLWQIVTKIKETPQVVPRPDKAPKAVASNRAVHKVSAAKAVHRVSVVKALHKVTASKAVHRAKVHSKGAVVAALATRAWGKRDQRAVPINKPAETVKAAVVHRTATRMRT